MAAAAPVAVLFPPQDRDWSLPVEASLTPRALERVSREAAVKSFDEAAKSLNMDWGMSWDGKQIQRWAEAIGDRMVREREAEVSAYKRGRRPPSRPSSTSGCR